MNFDIDDVRHPSQLRVIDPNFIRNAQLLLTRTRAEALRANRVGEQEALTTLDNVLKEVGFIAANYVNLYDIARKAISENQFLTKQINDRENSET